MIPDTVIARNCQCPEEAEEGFIPTLKGLWNLEAGKGVIFSIKE